MAVNSETSSQERLNEKHAGLRSGLEDYDRDDGRPPFYLTGVEAKLLGIAGVGFFLDAYDLFIINPVSTMLQYRLYGGSDLPAGLQGFIKAAANIGSVIGQFVFGYLADSLGRKAVYGKELMIIIVATIFCISDPTNDLSPNGALAWLGAFRILLGIGVGGDYPMSASVMTDRALIRKRGALLAWVFSAQGWGSLIGALVTLIVLLCYKHVMQDEGETSKVDGVWRIVIGISLIPAFATLYQRLTLAESRRFTASRRMEQDDDASVLEATALKDKKYANTNTNGDVNEKNVNEPGVNVHTNEVNGNGAGVAQDGETNVSPAEAEAGRGVGAKGALRARKAHFREFLIYFSEWRHARILIGTCVCWFLLDIAFYGINLNQNVVLEQIGFSGSGESAWEALFKIAVGNIIITALGFVPGYYVTILTIEYLGRKWIQIQGFLMAALFLAILAGKFHSLSTAAFVVNFAFLQFFFNFGANTTTYCYPAEVFPTRFRATAHGISAASGKAGAIISALAFNSLSESVGTPVVLWIFFGCCLAGAVFTLLLPEVKGRDPDLIDAEERRAAGTL